MIPQLLLKNWKDNIPLEKIHMSEINYNKISCFLEEYTFKDAISKYQIPVSNKILLSGASGCGKTTTAYAIAKALDKRILSLNLGNIVSSKLGETGRTLTELIRKAALEKAVLLIDEFDFIGKIRDYQESDSGEVHRWVNIMIQQMDYLSPDMILIASTNFSQALDPALVRRFELQISYEKPSKEQLQVYYKDLLSSFPSELTSDISYAYDVSYAQAKDLILNQIKQNIIKIEKQKYIL